MGGGGGWLVFSPKINLPVFKGTHTISVQWLAISFGTNRQTDGHPVTYKLKNGGWEGVDQQPKFLLTSRGGGDLFLGERYNHLKNTKKLHGIFKIFTKKEGLIGLQKSFGIDTQTNG